jgi:uncharacterized protein (DUF2249 family)
MTNRNIVTLDVREDFRAGQHPCDKIQGALSRIGNSETLRLLVPFEPVPIFEVARHKGLTYESRQISDGDWEVLFSRSQTAETPSPKSNGAKHEGCGCGCSASTTDIVELDARGLEPPQPMVKILEALANSADGSAVRARTDRRPIHLYPILEARGFIGESEEQPDGSFITNIRRS